MAAMFLAGCGESLNIDPAFVGTWHWAENVEWTYVFNEDGTGRRGDERQVQSFSWGTRDGVLVLDHGHGFMDDELTYAFSGNMLNLTGYIGNFDYFRFVPDLELVGTWVIFDGNFVEKTINADGTGFLMPFLGEPDERVDFNWYVAGNTLIRHMEPGLQAEWAYSISENTLTLLDDSGDAMEFTKGSLYQNTSLIGTWAWDWDNEWEYFFGENATGKRGRYGYETQIIWTTLNDILFVIDLDTLAVENWRFMITGGMLHLFDVIDADIRYSYERVN